MSQVGLSLEGADEAAPQDDVWTKLPEGIAERVIVKLKSRTIEVHLSPINTGIGLELQDAENANETKTTELVAARVRFVRHVQGLAESFADRQITCRVEVPVWSGEPSQGTILAILSALLEWYGEEEMVAKNWLAKAQVVCATALPDASGNVPAVRLQFSFANEAEKAALVKKRADKWLTGRFESLFGLRIVCEFAVDSAAEERVEAFRREVEASEQELLEKLAKERETAAVDKPAKPAKAYEGGQGGQDRPYRGRRRDDDGPLKPLTIGRVIDGPVTPIREIVDEMRRVAVEGKVFNTEIRTLPSGRTLVQFNITDFTSSISAKLFSNNERQLEALQPLADDVWLRIQGNVQYDTYAKELVFMVQDMMPVDGKDRQDTAPEKRVELHLHTTMSALDGVTPFAQYAKQAAAWGHTAIAVTDHGNAQIFPEAYAVAKKNGLKPILGIEAYVVDDGTPIVYREIDMPLSEETEYVVFDTETTGLNAREDTLIEIAAVRMKGKDIVGEFSSLIDPERSLSPKISELTGITQDMLVGQPKIEKVLPEFREFAQGAILVAHNAEFDVGFLGQCGIRMGMEPWTQPVIDTLSLARGLYPGEKNYRLKTLTQKFQVELVNHHRALADAEATGKVFAYMQKTLFDRGITRLNEINSLAGEVDVSRVRPFHATILVKTRAGLRNLYELISLSHTEYLHRWPRIPRSHLNRLREGLVIGTACQNGELIQAFLRGKSAEEIEAICKYYDFLELQPLSHYENLVRDQMVQSIQSIKDIHRQVVELGKSLDKPVVATGDVHFLSEQDAVFREVFLHSQNAAEAALQPPLYFRTTDEMLQEFQHLGEDAYDVVVRASQAVADWIEDANPIPDTLYAPVIDGAEEEITRLSYDKAKRLYGETLPEIVQARLEKELHSIISNGFAVIYLIAHKLVVKSLSDGYLVGSRGSVGSSLVATMTDITEVNPLAPHYLCPSCQYSEFLEDGSYGSGYDLPEKDCPKCGARLNRDGQDIPFETFLGFEGDKTPDIDLNFSGEYQPRAHKYTEELFGKDHVFRAGTISTVAEKTAYGYVRKFAEERGMVLRNAEIDRLVKGCTGIKRTTGQHPGGLMVVPSHMSIYDFTPVQFPADDKTAGTYTTHFEYKPALEHALLKLDILGHDDPTVIRMLQDLTGVDPKTIPLDDPQVLGLFGSTESLQVKSEDIRSNTGTYAIPEFGTKFVRQMLEDTRPTTFAELVRISGLSHGTDVWLNNAQELIRQGVATLSEVICARDDIMVYLIYKGLDPGKAFKIMEYIRKGKGVKEEDAEYMRQYNVPEWYIEAGRKIKYMFPKAHAAAYVLMAVRIAWFKIHHPLAFYAAYFSVRADDFDVPLMVQGKDAIVRKIDEIEEKGNAAATKEKNLVTVLEVALEMVVRGFRFLPIDLYQSHATQFLVMEEEKALLPPFAAVQGVGAAAAKSLYEACQEGPFLSIEDLQSRSRVSKTVIEILDGLGCLAGMPETNQLSLF